MYTGVIQEGNPLLPEQLSLPIVPTRRFIITESELPEPEGERLRGARAKPGVAHAEGRCLDIKFHNSSYIERNKDTRRFAKPESEIQVCVEGSAARVKIKKDLPRQERVPCIEEYFIREDHPEDRELLLGDKMKSQRAKRGRITKCSKASCRRLRDQISELKRLVRPIFVGLTFPDDFPSPKFAHRHLKNFLSRLVRVFQGSGAFWKMEMKPRLSGKNKGRVAPHFHLFVYGIEISVQAFKKWAKRAWWEVVGSGDYWHRRKGCSVIEVYDLKGVRIYLRKYFSKDFEHEDLDGIGRTWGHVGNIPWGEVKKVVVPTGVAYAYLRILRKKEDSERKQWSKVNPRFKYRPPHRGKRAFDTEHPERLLELIDLLWNNAVPF